MPWHHGQLFNIHCSGGMYWDKIDGVQMSELCMGTKNSFCPQNYLVNFPKLCLCCLSSPSTTSQVESIMKENTKCKRFVYFKLFSQNLHLLKKQKRLLSRQSAEGSTPAVSLPCFDQYLKKNLFLEQNEFP